MKKLMLPFVSFRLGNLLKILMQNFLNKTFTFLFITLMGCESIIDIFPPELEIITPQTDEVIYDDIIIAGTATDNNTVTEIKIYTQTKLGDTWLEEKITDGNDIEVSFPVWSRSIDHILVKAFDDVNNFDHIKIKINQETLYDMDFEAMDSWNGWSWLGSVYWTDDDKFSGERSLVLYGLNGAGSGIVSVTKKTRAGHVAFAFRRTSGCYTIQPEVNFLIDGSVIWNLEKSDIGIEVEGTSWEEKSFMVSEGTHTFSWTVKYACSNGNILFLDSIYLP
jgi:hypothetical protein|tara:strand:+ start:337 stop:1170 length:834 start_codon:yes stop_codon:yes gene_type:complete